MIRFPLTSEVKPVLFWKAPDFTPCANRNIIVQDKVYRVVDRAALVFRGSAQDDFVVMTKARSPGAVYHAEHGALGICNKWSWDIVSNCLRIGPKPDHHRPAVAILERWLRI